MKNNIVDIGEVWEHTTGKKIKIIARAETYFFGKTWIAENLDTGEFKTVSGIAEDMINWHKVEV